MLIVANGAFKSGSTWLYVILVELTGFPPPPKQYLNADWKNPSIADDQLAVLLRDLRPEQNYIVKNHFANRTQHDLLLACPDVRVFDIERDIRDVVVSAYHHRQRRTGQTQSFRDYYEEMGRGVAQGVVRFHALWSPVPSQVYCSSYERLHNDFANELRRIADFLQMPVSDATIERIREATALDSLRERYGEQDAEQKFFRKGQIGDWQNYFDDVLLADLEAAVAAALDKPGLLARMSERLRRLL